MKNFPTFPNSKKSRIFGLKICENVVLILTAHLHTNPEIGFVGHGVLIDHRDDNVEEYPFAFVADKDPQNFLGNLEDSTHDFVRQLIHAIDNGGEIETSKFKMKILPLRTPLTK